MRSITNFLLISAILVVAGCKTVEPPPPIVLTQWVFADCGVQPERSSVQLKPLSWQVINGRFSLSPQGYQDLSYNVTMALASMKEYEVVLAYYQACLDDNAAKAAAMNVEESTS
jgi:hypothetical protein